MQTKQNLSSQEELLLNKIKRSILDPLALELANNVQWIYLDNFSQNQFEKYPVAIYGNGSVLMVFIKKLINKEIATYMHIWFKELE